MLGLPGDVHLLLRQTLLQSEMFESDSRLRTLFDDKCLMPWRDQVPETQSRNERVDAIIHFLIGKRLRGAQDSALISLLEILRDRTDPNDAHYLQYIDLLNKLRYPSQEDINSGMAVNEPPQIIPERKPTRTSTFISYSHKDKQYLRELQVHLKHYIRQDDLKIWDDTRILPGARWRDELEQALQSTKVAVFLVSADFLASDFIIDYEVSPLLKVAKQEGVTLVPVILRSCAFSHSELAEFQSINPPSQPLALMGPAERDKVWSALAKQIWELLTDQQM